MPAVWTFAGCFCPKAKGAGGLSPGFQPGFNPGDRHPERRALKGRRQIERTNNAKLGSKLYTSQLRILVFAQR
jgi:hypothetical protein